MITSLVIVIWIISGIVANRLMKRYFNNIIIHTSGWDKVDIIINTFLSIFGPFYLLVVVFLLIFFFCAKNNKGFSIFK